jgi:hypothetical protein
MYLGYRQYQLLFDLPGLVVLLALIGCLVAVAWLAFLQRFRPAMGLAIFAVALAAMQTYRGAMVTNSSWVAMLGAIESTTGPERELRVSELRSRWQAQSMRALDWYVLSKKWNVCHSLWPQNGCVTPVASEQAAGVAREVLDQLATASDGVTPSR